MRLLISALPVLFALFLNPYYSYGQECINLAIGQPTTVSSNQGGSLGGYATDGNLDTRWESQFSDPQWILIDLGRVQSLCEAVIRWENASAAAFSIDISADSVSWTNAAAIAGNQQYINVIPLNASARYIRLTGSSRTTVYGYSIYEFEVYGLQAENCTTTPNQALNKPVSASSVGNPTHAIGNAVDGDLNTRWESAFEDPQFLEIDLQNVYAVCSVSLYWEDAYARDFELHFSADGQEWQTVLRFTDNASRLNRLQVQGNARFIRIYGTRRATSYGYSLFEVEVFGTMASLPVTLTEFNGRTGVNGTFLTWVTQEEVNTAYFSIERRPAASGTFREIGRVQALGNSRLRQEYTWTDQSAGGGSFIYRLKMTDHDGSFSYSGEIRVQGKQQRVNILYDPGSRLVRIHPGRETIRGVSLYDVSGMRQKFSSGGLTATTNLSVHHLASGIYLLHIQFEDGSRQVERLVIR